MLLSRAQHPSPQQRGHVASCGIEAAFNRESDTVSSFLPRSRTNVLLSQCFSFTLNWLVYLGARLGLPSLSSRMYTNWAVRKVFATKGESLNLRRSSNRGEKDAAFDLARLSWSVVDRVGDCSS